MSYQTIVYENKILCGLYKINGSYCYSSTVWPKIRVAENPQFHRQRTEFKLIKYISHVSSKNMKH